MAHNGRCHRFQSGVWLYLSVAGRSESGPYRRCRACELWRPGSGRGRDAAQQEQMKREAERGEEGGDEAEGQVREREQGVGCGQA